MFYRTWSSDTHEPGHDTNQTGVNGAIPWNEIPLPAIFFNRIKWQSNERKHSILFHVHVLQTIFCFMFYRLLNSRHPWKRISFQIHSDSMPCPHVNFFVLSFPVIFFVKTVATIFSFCSFVTRSYNDFVALYRCLSSRVSDRKVHTKYSKDNYRHLLSLRIQS